MVKTAAFHSPEGILLAHMLLLGWATMIAMGASYQVTQVLLRTSMYSRKLAFFQVIVYVAGVLLLLVSFWNWTPLGMGMGGGLIVLAVAVYAFNLGVTYVRSKLWTPVTVGASLSLLDLCVTVVLGTTLGIAAWTGWSPARYELLFFTHMWFGLVGWLAGLLVSYRLKLLPMFYVSRKTGTKLNYAIILFFQAGVWLGAGGWWSENRMLSNTGLLCVVVSLGILGWFVRGVRNQSSGKQPIGAVRVADVLIAVTFLLAVVWTLLHVGSGAAAQSYRVVSTLMLYVVLGWFSASILAYLTKIIPFLWWAHQFRTKEQKKGAVLLAEMVPQSRLTMELWGYLTGVGLVMCGNLFGASAVAALGICIMLADVALFLVELARVFRY
ncbi:hypothetical protein G3578_02080 [Brevibacillus sp. SYP-B805]|uniref:hypothetical protein n=1 Tax=Brevibacillus sp. SYP-B805 TaxID=1578199 RepID=UPI0013EA73A6|nr:hypothetical protein [Brevibacillus sp. SYP-B805]NGQ93961.1 hypothetical protein [Brevibacillus sp. SYP-B805]